MKLSILLKLFPVFVRCFGRLPVGHLRYMAKQLCNENARCHNGRVYINTFFPPYPSKAFSKFLDVVFERKRVPFSTYFAVTDRCPFKCPHCSYGEHMAGHMDTQQALEAIEQIKSIGTITIGFTGGEPLLRDDIVTLVEATVDTNCVMFSTGHRLTKELAEDLCKSGLSCLTIGLESDNSEYHDKIRGVDDSFEEGIKAIELSQDAGLYTAISTVGTRDKLNDGTINRMAEMATKLGVHEFRILEPVPTGRYSNDNCQILNTDESKGLADFHKQWNRKGKGPAIASFAHLESDEMFGCGAGYHHLFIDAVGNVCPCDLTQISMGNIAEEPLLAIWNRMSEWFNLPRCGCFAKEICNEVNSEATLEFPICKDKSIKICQAHKRGDDLPKIYKNLLKDQAPTNPPLSQQ